MIEGTVGACLFQQCGISWGTDYKNNSLLYICSLCCVFETCLPTLVTKTGFYYSYTANPMQLWLDEQEFLLLAMK